MIDAGSNSPYYNSVFTAGTGDTRRIGTVPLVASSTAPAWMADIPFTCENGPIPPGGSAGCAAGVDDTLLSDAVAFQSFIESDRVLDGKTYQVLYGGVQWGYLYNNVDNFSNKGIPEPSSPVLLVGSLALLVGARKVYGSGAAKG